MTQAQPGHTYYGWTIVFALLVVLTFASGLSFYNHAIYLNALAARPNFSVNSASTAVSVFFLSGGLGGLWIGQLVRDFDPRFCIIAGALICSVALSALAVVTRIWELLIVYALFGVGFAASSLIPATTLVTRWFHRRRALALSIASTGLSLGGVLITPLTALLVDWLGFQRAAPVIGLLYALGVIPVAWVWLRPDPAALGLLPDGDEPAPVGADEVASSKRGASSHEYGLSFRQALNGWLFWAMALAYVFLMLAQVAGIAHQYGLVRETLSEAQTALAVAIVPVASIVGRLAGGWVVEQFSMRRFTILMMALQTLSLLLLASGLGVVTLCLGLFLFGISVGNLLMLQPLLVAEAFGVRDYARLYSVSNLLMSLGPAVGPVLLGMVYSASGNRYGAAYLVAATAAATGLTLFISGGPLAAAERDNAAAPN